MPECSDCCAPLGKGEFGKCERCKSFAGWYDDSIAYNPDTDCMDLRKVKVTCPYCGRVFAALLSKFTKPMRQFSTDLDGLCMAVECESFCRVCHNKITFKINCD